MKNIIIHNRNNIFGVLLFVLLGLAFAKITVGVTLETGKIIIGATLLAIVSLAYVVTKERK